MKKLNILLLGGGGREHALAHKLSQSDRCGSLYVAPGNGGTAEYGVNVVLDISDFDAVASFCVEKSIDMIVVGPEAPLVEGIADSLRTRRELEELICIGPGRQGAMLEGSKAFAKEFMSRHSIPTARYREFAEKDLTEGLEYIASHALPVVLKADGLAAGKGVVICGDHAQAEQEFRLMLGGKFGEASSRIVVEEFLSGIEFSVFVLTDGVHYKILPVAKDYKRIGEGDTGLNTGGMGAISPVPFVDAPLMSKVVERIVEPTIRGLKAEDIDYKGFIFFGLISVNGDPYVIEYNCRLGDPETQSVLPRLKNDLVEMMISTGEETLGQIEVRQDNRYAATVVCVSGGYPGSYEKGVELTLPTSTGDNTIIYHAGTARDGSELVTSGGRVVAVTSLANTMHQALAQSYDTARKIEFRGKYFRSDIGFDL